MLSWHKPTFPLTQRDNKIYYEATHISLHKQSSSTVCCCVYLINYLLFSITLNSLFTSLTPLLCFSFLALSFLSSTKIFRGKTILLRPALSPNHWGFREQNVCVCVQTGLFLIGWGETKQRALRVIGAEGIVGLIHAWSSVRKTEYQVSSPNDRLSSRTRRNQHQFSWPGNNDGMTLTGSIGNSCQKQTWAKGC